MRAPRARQTSNPRACQPNRRRQVFKVSDFGAHVQLPNGMPALVHISQWAHHRVRDIHEVASEGMEVDVLCQVGARAPDH